MLRLLLPDSLSATGPERHQARLAFTVLLLMSAYLALIGSINLWVFTDYWLASINAAAGVACLVLLAHFWQGGNLQRISQGTVLVLCLTLMLFIYNSEGRSYSLLWVTVLPPIAFFLLGRQAGASICAIAFTGVVVFYYDKIPTQEPELPGLASLLNLIEVLVAQWFLFRLYEGSRADALAELAELSRTDKLTGLYNRSHLDNLLHDLHARHQQWQRPLTLVLGDVDHFKRINDEFGHLAGDKVLQDIAEVLDSQIRTSDYCGRWGGEEFLIICPDTDSASARPMIQRLGEAVVALDSGHQPGVSISFGMATLREGESVDALLRRTDGALYAAKHQGRDRIVLAE